MSLSTCKLIHVLYVLFPFTSICVQIEHEIFLQNFSITNGYPLSLDAELKKVTEYEIWKPSQGLNQHLLDSWSIVGWVWTDSYESLNT